MNEDLELKDSIYELCTQYPEATIQLRGMGITIEDLINIAVANLDNLFNDPSLRSTYTDAIVSDCNEKRIKRIANKKQLSPTDIEFLMQQMDNTDDWNDSDDIDNEMLEGYAKNLKNYLYTYKEEATQIDPSIDPNEQHIGPMAQDIEKVAPDCVKETKEGVKVVDGNRLALVNAGVIGDLARRLLHLEKEAVNG